MPDAAPTATTRQSPSPSPGCLWRKPATHSAFASLNALAALPAESSMVTPFQAMARLTLFRSVAEPPRARRVVLVGPELRGRAASAGASLVSAAARPSGAGGQASGQCRRGGEQGQRLSPSVTVLGTQCSVSFQRFICRCSPHSRWGRTGEQIPSEHFTCPAVDKRRYRIRFRHPPAMQPRFRACRVGHFPGRLRIRKRDPEGSLEKKSHLNQW